jgi:hypothetical protein
MVVLLVAAAVENDLHTRRFRRWATVLASPTTVIFGPLGRVKDNLSLTRTSLCGLAVWLFT